MALSMFLCATARARGPLAQQSRTFSQISLAQRAIANTLPSKLISLQQINTKVLSLHQANTTPILNSVRSFKTTAVRMHDKPHDHAKLWVVEKAVTAVMIPLIPIGLLLPNKICDIAIAILVSAHTFWGLDAIRVEYIRMILFGPAIVKVATYTAYFISAFIMGGLFYITFNDIGLCRGFRRIWKNIRNKK